MSTVENIITAVGYNLNRTISATSEPRETECISWIDQTVDWIVQTLAELGSEIGRTTGTITCAESVITAITQASPGSVTSEDHGFDTGEVVTITDVVGMTEVNDTEFTVTVVDDDTYTIGVDTSGYTAYSSGGNAYKAVYDDFASSLYAVAIMTTDEGEYFSGWIEKSTGRVPLKLVTEATKVNYIIGSTGEPDCFFLDGSNNIVFLDTPDDAYTIKIPYYAMQSITSTSDTIPFRGIFDNLIIESVSTKYLYRTREDAGIEWNWSSFVKERAEHIVKLRKRTAVRIM